MSMLELFRLDAHGQLQTLTSGLLALERAPTAAEPLEACMRAAHSLKGAARIIGLDAGVDVAHAMEDCFVAAQRQQIGLGQEKIDALLRAVDLLERIAKTSEADIEQWATAKRAEVNVLLAALATAKDRAQYVQLTPAVVHGAEAPAVADRQSLQVARPPDGRDRVLRVKAENLNRLLGLAGESLVESRWLKPFSGSLLRMKRMHHDAEQALETARTTLAEQTLPERTVSALATAQDGIRACHDLLSQHLVQLELFDYRFTGLAHRLYEEALACRMRPFGDGVQNFPRIVRDLARSLGKKARLEIVGEATEVDRDILERLDAPLGHLLRNAIDHAVESPQERVKVGKASEGVVRLEARHSAGMLQILVSDDGCGIDLPRLRATVVDRQLTTESIAQELSTAELLEFLFLPGFTLKDTVTEVSGRGVGLDVVRHTVKQLRGTVRVTSKFGAGTCFHMQLPLTLSVVRTLRVQIGGEPYAFALASILRTLKVSRAQIEMLEGREIVKVNDEYLSLVNAQELLGGADAAPWGEELAVIVVGERGTAYGLVVDRFLGESELVVQPLDERVGKIKDIAAGALMEDGAPVLIVDVEDLLVSLDKLVATRRLRKVMTDSDAKATVTRKRILIVEDSVTVRELERKLLSHEGYEVVVAVDGMDGWNAVRSARFDLVVTDVDMPRLDGIELVTLIRRDPNLKALPVMIVSYKDREENRQRGLDAGADHYLTKGSFHDETLVRAVMDLIGEATI